ncbi:ankyrin repeat domain-containing protein [Wolbachia endosymbiont of Diaphorina citri]|uniref:ankyrin repeat domain-containing protein n=1 Tax=Wolbachia endosymbiont of Diaphorina citri TaxID=116598 RepID=UPI001F439521|nr:ankyrin repeat domain-containing protein [Wolbachia endosymbiont of Diaphorina citri]
MTGEIEQNIQCDLENFASWLSQLSKEELKKIIYEKHNIQDDELDVQIKRKIDNIVREGHRDCLNMSKLLIEKGFYSYIIDERNNGFDEDSEPVEWRESVGRLIPPGKFQSSIPCFHLESTNILVGENTELMFDISNSSVAKGDIEKDKNINKYSLLYGNNPILLAISKGWNHINEDDYSRICDNLQEHINQGELILPKYEENLERKLCIRNGIDADKKILKKCSGLLKQRDIISKLLEREDLDINCIHLSNGMTPLHIACLRGDSPELIQRLLDKGANPDAVNYKGEKPIDMIGYSYEDTQKIIESITGGYKFESEEKYDENKSVVATLPTRKEREDNIKVIREILHAAKSRSNTSTVDDQIPKYNNAKKAITISTLVAITVMFPLSIYLIVQGSFVAAGIVVGCIIVAAAVLYHSDNSKADNKLPRGLLNDFKSGPESFKERSSIL